MVEERVLGNGDRINEPLGHRLRNAAIDRAATEAERIDDYVLDEDGVLDLREFERDPIGASVADPAKALAGIRGRLGNAHEGSEPYDESEAPRSRWRLGQRTRHSPGEVIPRETTELPRESQVPASRESQVPPPREMPPLSRLSMVPPAQDAQPTPAVASDDAEVPGNEVAPTGSIAESIEPETDLRDEGRPTAGCPKCMGLGHRDLFDRFSQVEFYSCDSCMHMWQQDLS
jgi:hypothetical protein